MEVEEGESVVGRIKIGVCVMEKKVKCGSEVLFSVFILLLAAARICISRLLLLTNYRFRCSFFLLKSPLWFWYRSTLFLTVSITHRLFLVVGVLFIGLLSSHGSNSWQAGVLWWIWGELSHCFFFSLIFFSGLYSYISLFILEKGCFFVLNYFSFWFLAKCYW